MGGARGLVARGWQAGTGRSGPTTGAVGYGGRPWRSDLEGTNEIRYGLFKMEPFDQRWMVRIRWLILVGFPGRQGRRPPCLQRGLAGDKGTGAPGS